MTSRSLKWLTFAVFSVGLSLSSWHSRAAVIFSDIYIFGDSLSDTGNTAQSTGNLLGGIGGYGNNRRFSNGILWHEYLSLELGLPTSHSLSGGNNFAYGGAQINDATGFSSGVITQYNQYLTRQAGNPFDADALYIAWAGGNDMRGLVGNTNPLPAIASVLSTFNGILSDMIVRGATTLLVPNLPNLGVIPEFRTSANASSANFVSLSWNTLLEQMLIDLARATKVDIYMLDVYQIFDDILSNPASEGFTNTTGQCRSLFFGLVERSCNRANEFVFWDAIHPTTAAHAVLGRETYQLLASGNTVYREVPAPATLILLLIGSVGLLLGRNIKPIQTKPH